MVEECFSGSTESRLIEGFSSPFTPVWCQGCRMGGRTALAAAAAADTAVACRSGKPPEQQLEGLRMARDYYRGVADRIRDGEVDPLESPEHRQAREQYARRIAAAYEISFNTQSALIRGKHGI